MVVCVAACGSTRHATRGSTTQPAAPAGLVTPTPTATATPNACVARANEPAPSGTIPANFATALAFAPDGRLFWAERSGTVRVWQNGASRVFASVRTVTSESGGGYSERGLLGLAISPTFSTDRFVYAFYSDSNYATQHVIRWTDCNGTAVRGAIIDTFPAGGDWWHEGGASAL